MFFIAIKLLIVGFKFSVSWVKFVSPAGSEEE